MGGVLGQFGLRAIPFGIAAMVLGFILKSAGTQAGPADTLSGLRVSVFGTIHPEIFRLSAPLGSGSASDRVRWASLEPQVGLFDAPAKAAPMPTGTSLRTCRSAWGPPWPGHRTIRPAVPGLPIVRDRSPTLILAAR